MSRPPNRKPQRPRLEQSTRSRISARVNDYEGFVFVDDVRNKSDVALNLADAKRLHAFLGKAIAYLEAKKAGRK